MNIGTYAKSIVLIIAAGLGILTAALTDNVVSATEAVNIAIGIVTAVGVYLIPNLSEGAAKYAKFFVGLGGAAFAALATILGGTLGFADITSSDWLGVVLAGLAAVSLYIVPNEPRIETVKVVPASGVGGESFAGKSEL